MQFGAKKHNSFFLLQIEAKSNSQVSRTIGFQNGFQQHILLYPLQVL